jgi:2-polyprenyl-3-methyl-5-hydroxy-6-metoxy-1,4-benzoquinol methylase
VQLPDRSKIDQDWPSADLEPVDQCPYCEAKERTIAYQDVQDWTFYCAPGKWTYWDCSHCSALYLSPRPTRGAIGRAYATYYTHGETGLGKARSTAKSLVRNLCYSAWYGIDLQPRLPLPKGLFPLLSVLRGRIAAPPFIVRELHRLPVGRVVDVGCGGGGFLDAARQFGWTTLGIEMDPQAAKSARGAGHVVIEGSFEVLDGYQSEFDCVICSHVLEHVHEPKALLAAIAKALKPGGHALIALPNAGSAVRRAVGANWRGLEAPRHLAIPGFLGLVEFAKTMGLEKISSSITKFDTLAASTTIAQQRRADTAEFQRNCATLQSETTQISEINSDFINIVFRRKPPQ